MRSTTATAPRSRYAVAERASRTRGPGRGVYLAALHVFRRLPAPVRRSLVRAGTPGFTVGAVVGIRHDGKYLFLRQPHRPGWSLPGGLLARGESAAEGATREVWEETGLQVSLGLPATAHVNPVVRRVDIIFVTTVDRAPAVQAGGEALEHRWIGLADVDDMDGSTREILSTLQRLEHDAAAG
ncbi:MAG: NUDIX hydrolase [Micrococcales bacterium]|nr:MAG: NUDIX hydrolase [Micrococcales bacterium]